MHAHEKLYALSVKQNKIQWYNDTSNKANIINRMSHITISLVIYYAKQS